MAGKYNLRVDFDKTKKLKAKNVFFLHINSPIFYIFVLFFEPLKVKIYTPSKFHVIIQRYMLSPPCSYSGFTSMIHMKFGGIEA